MELREFIVRAKRKTYASGAEPKKLANGFEELNYEEGELKYNDLWKTGTNSFGGREIVAERGETFWMMNYYGKIISEEVEAEKVYAFLRKALSKVEKEKPFRGPSSFKEKGFEYLDDSEGSVEMFSGIEQILFNGKLVYRLDYHGGRL